MPLQAQKEIYFPPVSLINGSGSFPVLIICEHASKRIPKELGGLGLSETALKSHIAWDPGADEIATSLSELLDAPYVRGEVSRLVYDCNRHPDAHNAIPVKSEKFDIPGNKNLSEQQRQERIQFVYEPFKKCVVDTLTKFTQPPTIITIHSYTPVYQGQERTVELGILHDEETRLADAILLAAPKHTQLNTQRNQPYGPLDGVTHTLTEHGIANGLLNVMIEIKNDLITSSEQCDLFANMLHGLIVDSLASIESLSNKQEQTG